MSEATVETKALPRLGDFEGKALVHAFDPDPSDAAYGTSFFGLVESDFWPYGAVRTASGRWCAYYRGISGTVTTGLTVLRQDGNEPLQIDPRSGASYVGPIGRSIEPGADLCASLAPQADQPFVLRSGPSGVEWHEAGVLDLTGPIAGPGLQMFNAWREPDGRMAQLFHVHLGFEVHGTVLGEPASGYLGLARAHLPYGVPWQTEHRFGPASGLCTLWIAFLNVYENGSSERGMMSYGGPGNRFRFATVVTREGLEFATDQLDAEYRVSSDHFLSTVDFHVGNGQEWRFRSEPQDHLDFSEMISGFADDPPTGYHVSLGSMRRVGDEREPVVQIAWVEGFPEAWARGG